VHDRILAAAVALFDRQGPDATKVDEICALADVAQKTFFNHFPAKQHLLREIAEGFVDETRALVEEARRLPGPTSARLARLFRRLAEESERAGPMHKELILEVIRVAHVDGSGPEQTRRLHEAFGALLRDGVAAGDISRADDPDFLTEMVVGVFHTVMLNWVAREDYPLGEHLDEAARFLARALARDADASETCG
jgi:AcrR family transcriptional regulator